MNTRNRIQRALKVEELEARVAPVILTGLDFAGQTTATRLGDLCLRYDFAAPSLADLEVNGEVLAIDGTELNVGTGRPVLPYRPVSLLLPPGTDLAGVDVWVSDGISLGTMEPVIGASPVLASEEGGDPGTPGELSPDWEPQLYEVSGVYRAAGYTIASIMLYPVLFDPVTSEAIFYSSMTVSVNTTAATPQEGEWLSPVRNSTADRSHIAALVDNPWLMSDYEGGEGAAPAMGNQPLSAGTYDYVIITSSQLVEAFEPLRSFKESRGVKTTITTTSYIYSNYTGIDHAEQVRNFIRDAYTSWGVSYVLLGGDIDVVPYRGAYASTVGYTDAALPADLYFACLDGSWNSDGDSYWGETNDGPGGTDVDLLAEVYVGRAPVGDVTQTNNFINKTIAYETSGPANPNNALWIGEYLWNGPRGPVYGSHSKDPIRTQVMPQDYTFTTLYEENGTYSPGNVIEGLNAGPHVVNHLGHANRTYVMGLQNYQVDALTNTSPFLVYSQGCYAGAFDHSDCIAEHFVFNSTGAFAAIMNSRYGWGSSLGVPAYSHDFDMTFYEAIYQDGHTNIGMANQLSKEYNLGFIADSTYRWIYFELNLLGDPQTPLFMGPTPFSVSSSDPARGGLVSEPPTAFTVTFTSLYNPATVDVTDLSVNGLSPDSVAQIDAYTLEFTFATSPVTEEGVQSMQIAAGALEEWGTGEPIVQWDATFIYGTSGITVVDSIAPEDDLIMDFGSVEWDGVGGARATATFSIINTGEYAVHITDVIGPSGPHFSLSGLPSGSFYIYAGQQATGRVTFDPQTLLQVSDQITIHSNDPEHGTIVIELTGCGDAGNLDISDSVSPYDDRAIEFSAAPGGGEPSETATFTISNSGNVDLTINSVYLALGWNFTMTGMPEGPFVLGPGESRTGTVTFLPTSGDTLYDAVFIRSNDPDESFARIELVGRGYGVILGSGNRYYSFADANGDRVTLSFSGRGTAIVADADQGMPNGTDIAFITMSGTDSSTSLSVTCSSRGGGDVTLGTVTTREGETIGSLSVSAWGGALKDTNITVNGHMRTVFILGSTENVDVTVGGDVGTLLVMGELGDGSSFDIAGSATTMLFLNGLNDSTVSASGSTSVAMVQGGMDGSSLEIGGSLSVGVLTGAMRSSTLQVGGDMGTSIIACEMENATVEVGTPGVGGNVGTAIIIGGLHDSSFIAHGDAGMVYATGDILNSTVAIDGRAAMVFLTGDLGEGSSLDVADVGWAMFLGEVEGTAAVRNALTGRIWLFRSVKSAGRIEVKGDLEGEVYCFSEMLGDVEISGDMSGRLSATLFGDVTIQGDFSGRISSSGGTRGSGNTLTVNGDVNGGIVTPADAFENYAGYP